MMQQVEDHEDRKQGGLRFIKSERRRYHDSQNIHDKLYDSRSGGAIFYRYHPRDIAALCAENHVEPRVHESVLKRLQLGTQGYAPCSLPERFDIATSKPEDLGAARETMKEAFEGKVKISKRVSGDAPAKSMLLEDINLCVRARKGTYWALLAGMVTLFIHGFVKGPVNKEAALWIPSQVNAGLRCIIEFFAPGDWFYDHILGHLFRNTALALFALMYAFVLLLSTLLARRVIRAVCVRAWRTKQRKDELLDQKYYDAD